MNRVAVDLAERIQMIRAGVNPDAPNARLLYLDPLGTIFLGPDADSQTLMFLPWRALELAREWGLPPPAWAIEYFTDQAYAIEGIVERKEPNEAEAVGRLLGFGGKRRGRQGSNGQQAKRIDRDYPLAVAAVLEMRRLSEDGRNTTQLQKAAFEDVATHWNAHQVAKYKDASKRTIVSRSTVERAYNALRDRTILKAADAAIEHLKKERP